MSPLPSTKPRMAAFTRRRGSGARALWYSRTWSETVTLVGKGCGRVELQLAGPEKFQLTVKVGICEQLHRF